jgi:hypothetical protein
MQPCGYPKAKEQGARKEFCYAHRIFIFHFFHFFFLLMVFHDAIFNVTVDI